MRSGPGERYPILWDYRRKDLPILVIGERGPWRYVRDPEGTTGWMHTVLLTGRRMVWLTETSTLTERPESASRPVVRAGARVTGRLHMCKQSWCKITIGEKTGWLRAQSLWGIFEDESG